MTSLVERLAVRPAGRFTLLVWRYADLIEEVDEPNLVVDGFHAYLAGLVAGSADLITQIGFGTNGAPPVGGNTGLTNPVLLPLGAATQPIPTEVQWTFSLGSGDANGTSIAEFGLLSTAGVLFARKVRAAPLAKTSSISLSGTWTISF